MTDNLPGFESGYVEVNGTKLYYEVAGEGEPIVFVHGFSLDRRMWDGQFAAFARDYRVLRYDCRGFGKSLPAPVTPFSHSHDLRALMDALDTERAHLVGLSMGGGAIVDFAVESPGRALSLVPVDAPVGGFRWITDFQSRVRAAGTVANESGIAAALELWMGDDLFAPAMANPAAASALREIVGGYTGWHWTSGANGITRNTPTIDLLGTISAPTLVVVGEHDLEDFHAMADTLATGIPGAAKVVMAGVGHMSNMEDPEGFNATLGHFLTGL